MSDPLASEPRESFGRILLVILDGVGAGQAPDAADFGDEGSDTLLHVHQAVGLRLPNMASLGLSRILPLGTPAKAGGYGTMVERSIGKDTTTGHWEIAGIVLERPFPTYPQGFPQEILDAFSRETGRGVLVNRPFSGTKVIEDFGDEHCATGALIVYTSADSVFQIAAHEDVVPVPELYRICQIARRILSGKHAVGRVIARPFAGKSGRYVRTERRHDYSLEPPGVTVLDMLKETGHESIGVGKIEDIFAGRGLTRSYPVKGNPACFAQTLSILEESWKGLAFVNLVDFDMLYGHRNDPRGFAEALEWFDSRLPEIQRRMSERDLLILTADHGNDPTTPSTDHSRERVPLLVWHAGMRSPLDLGERSCFADIAATIAENFGIQGRLANGASFLGRLFESS